MAGYLRNCLALSAGEAIGRYALEDLVRLPEEENPANAASIRNRLGRDADRAAVEPGVQARCVYADADGSGPP